MARDIEYDNLERGHTAAGDLSPVEIGHAALKQVSGSGRPEHLFPKHSDRLSVEPTGVAVMRTFLSHDDSTIIDQYPHGLTGDDKCER